ncbi:MAG: alpha-galactosidase [Anaerolineae bacterium]|nr:alpha-galactosidase [Anaerolineae bacterium]
MTHSIPLSQERQAAVHYRVGDAAHTLRLDTPEQATSAHGLHVDWHWQATADEARTWLVVTHQGDVPLRLDAVDVGTAIPGLGVPASALSVYQHGWGSWTPVMARHLERSLYTEPGTPEYQRTHQPHLKLDSDAVLASEWVTVVAGRVPQTDGHPSLLAGFVTTHNQLSEIQVRTDGSALTARCTFDGAVLLPGETVRSEVLLLKTGHDPLALLEAWAEAAGQEMSARVPAHIPTGWCTWYYFYGENSAQDVLDNVAAIAEHALPLDVILLDDGFQTAIGDWLSIDADKFPAGMLPVARAIRDAGHQLGIWTAPFGAAEDSQLFAAHPDWFLKDEAGEPVVGWIHWGTTCYALDCTHPQALAWLRQTFREMREVWGVTFFKIDFIFAAAHPGRHHDPAATRAQALYRGVTAVREGIGDDAFLLGCGAPMGPCVGLVDGMRIGPDVDPNWHPLWRHDLSMPSAESALRNAITRAPFHGRLWANDPDCLLVRQRGDELDMVLNEMRSLTALIALLGGLVVDSDNLPSIRPGRLKYLRQALPPTGLSARPLDLFQNELPRCLLLPVEREWGRWWVAGLVNWDDETTSTTVHLSELDLPPGQYHVFNYWRQRYLGTTGDAVTLRRHQPHETVVLLFKPLAERPDLLTTTFHVCQGVAEVADVQATETSLRVVLEKAGEQFGDVLFTLPQGWRVLEATVDGVRRDVRAVAPGVVALGVTLAGRAEVELTFECNCSGCAPGSYPLGASKGESGGFAGGEAARKTPTPPLSRRSEVTAKRS